MALAQALVGALLTSLYTFRMVFVVFFGEVQTHVSRRPGWAMSIPVIVLCALSIVGGFVDRTLGFSRFLGHGPAGRYRSPRPVSARRSQRWPRRLMFAAGVFACVYSPARRSALPNARDRACGSARVGLRLALRRVFVQPVLWFARVDKNDFVDAIVNALAALTRAFWRLLSDTETGRVRWYAAGLALGAVVFVGSC